jgi:hypothetical protein
LSIATGTQVCQKHLARSTALVEQLPEGLISGVAEPLQQGFAQIEPCLRRELQSRRQNSAALLKLLQRPACNGAPSMHKWTIRGSLSEGIHGAGLSSGVPELLQQ